MLRRISSAELIDTEVPSRLDVLIMPEATMPAGAVELLYNDVFGPARFRKTSYRFRDGVAAVPELSWVAREGGRLVGAIHYWPILVGDAGHPALLLGPLAIAQDRAGRGIGRTLVFKTLEIAARLGYDLVLLVGDPEYYRRFGFVPATQYGFMMPGESRPDRLQVAALKDGVFGRVTGKIHRNRYGLPANAARSTANANVLPFKRAHRR